MLIYKYKPEDKPDCVLDGGYEYDGTYCLGFGLENDASEISIEAATTHYDSMTVPNQTDMEGNPIVRRTAEEFLTEHEASACCLVKEQLASTDAGAIRLIDDSIRILIDKGIITLEDFDIEAQDKYVAREVLRSQLK